VLGVEAATSVGAVIGQTGHLMRTAVVTGASGGIGLETARALAQMDHRVVLLCRNPEKAEAARADIESTVPGAALDIVLADLSRMDQVRTAATAIEGRLERLDVLVNNAGVSTRRRSETPEGLDLLLATNHLGPFLLTSLLLPLLRRSAPSRIVNVASDAHKFSKLRLDDLQATRGYGILGLPRYGETKLMNILFTRELARRLEGSGVTVNAVHPGAVATNLGAPPKVFAGLASRFMRTPADGAATSVVVATDPALADVTGGYFVNSKRADDKLNRHARDDELARRLWDRSEQLTGARFD
jgi:NAD(P)-dependent dehydrogenase (short-subunit alcohol dehydrogenase family)